MTKRQVARDIGIGLLLFAAYLVAEHLDWAGREAAALRTGRGLLRAEQWAHLAGERSLNHWLSTHHVLAEVANYEYAFAYLVTALVCIVWLMRRHPRQWPQARTSFVIVNLGAILTFAVLPTAPPRLIDAGFADTVRDLHTWGSWGSAAVAGANTLAAMPSLHLAWAVWVSTALAMAGARHRWQLLSALHVLVTLVVIVATGNHYLLDAVAGVVLALVAAAIARRRHDVEGTALPTADAFFLDVEDTGAPQTVGGVTLLAGPVDLDRARALVRAEVADLPRLRRRLAPRSRWRRARWLDLDVDELDWDWHVAGVEAGAGAEGLAALVARLSEEPLPRDRPLWRFLVVRLADGGSGLVLLMHHSVADGIGTVMQALHLFRPRAVVPTPDGASPGPLVRAAAVAAGLAQLATDGRAAAGLPGPGPGMARAAVGRDFAVGVVPLDRVRAAARAQAVRVTDVVATLFGAALVRTHPELVGGLGSRVRAAVPLLVRMPDDGPEGNATAAVMVDLPLERSDPATLIRAVGERTARLRRPTRVLASRFVMASALRPVPPPAAAWFARTVYGRRHFHGVLSNMPGPERPLSFDGVRLTEVWPVLPLAPGTAFSLGVLGWDGVLGIGLATDPALIDAGRLTQAMAEVLDDLLRDVPAPARGQTDQHPHRHPNQQSTTLAS